MMMRMNDCSPMISALGNVVCMALSTGSVSCGAGFPKRLKGASSCTAMSSESDEYSHLRIAFSPDSSWQ